jgi:rod shape-determining protein MreD
MSLLFAAVGATVAALLELTVIPYLKVGAAHPHPVLVLGVIWAVVAGIEGGLVWAFVGGLVLDVLAQRPLGSTAFALLIAIGGAWVLGLGLSRLRPIAPIVAVLVFSFIYSMTLFVLLGALGQPIRVADPVGMILPGVLYDGAIAVLVGPLVVALHDRRAAQERADW